MDFVPLDRVDATSLRWLRTSEEPLEFDLLAGDQGVARLAWSGPSGSLATARTANAAWTLKRVGFLNPRVTVRADGTPADAARLSVHFNYHRIEVAGGSTYRFHRAGVLVPAWKVTTEGGRELLHIEPVREGRKLMGGAVIAPADATGVPDLPILLAVSWYFIVLAWFEDEALVPLEGTDAPVAGDDPTT
ncbi:MAG TPA: hypothetical protein VMF04_05125 [Thermoplasmata archaeon]|nr:hypothetical protein [Thermoplasmata archaeon]